MTLLNSGIYKILNIANGKFYIGSAKNFEIRFSKHRWCFENKRHPNRYLQASWDKYGPAAFEFHILEHCGVNYLIEREQLYIDTLKPHYNLSPTAGSNLGVKYTEESKLKMSSWQIGRKMSEEAKAKMRESAINRGSTCTGYKHTKETKLKMSEANKGKKLSNEHKEKIRLKLIGNKSRTGQKLSEAEKLKKRKIDLWPHEKGNKCPCEECLNKRNAYMLNRYYFKKLQTIPSIYNSVLSFGC